MKERCHLGIGVTCATATHRGEEELQTAMKPRKVHKPFNGWNDVLQGSGFDLVVFGGDAVALSHEAFTKAFLGTEIRHSVQGRPGAVTTSLVAAEDEHYVIGKRSPHGELVVPCVEGALMVHKWFYGWLVHNDNVSTNIFVLEET